MLRIRRPQPAIPSCTPANETRAKLWLAWQEAAARAAKDGNAEIVLQRDSSVMLPSSDHRKRPVSDGGAIPNAS